MQICCPPATHPAPVATHVRDLTFGNIVFRNNLFGISEERFRNNLYKNLLCQLQGMVGVQGCWELWRDFGGG